MGVSPVLEANVTEVESFREPTEALRENLSLVGRNRLTEQNESWLRSHFYSGDVREAYERWPEPHAIISDGAYGVGGFPGDPRTPNTEELTRWYEPHVAAWSKAAKFSTTLWFWNTEIGWALVHPLLDRYGWDYVETIVWDKGIAHIAGNVNGDTIRRFPVATEICVLYRRRLEFPAPDGPLLAKQWLRQEWQRAGLRLSEANQACGVKNAATRKYLTQDWLWYFPPADVMARLVTYANQYGNPAGRPYFSLNGKDPVAQEEWAKLRHTWNHVHGVTNVWSHPPLHGEERYRGNGKRSAPRVYRPGKNSAVHLNQKPLEFMRCMLKSSTNPGDVVWEPFGGLCTATVAAIELGRNPYVAEVYETFQHSARTRLLDALDESGFNERK